MSSNNQRKYEIISLLMNRYKDFNIEIYYLLKWIIDDATLIDNLEFTKHSNVTPRGLKIQFNTESDKPFIYFKNKLAYSNFDQIIHDLRMNQNEILYLELVLFDHHIERLLDEVQIDNPFVPGYQSFEDKIEKNLQQISRQFYIKNLENRINEAIENADYQQLEVLSTLLIEYKKEFPDD